MNLKFQGPYRLALDLGANSIGWGVLPLKRIDADRYEPAGTGQGGVRIFPDGRDPQSKTSNAVDRRIARSARVRRDRFLRRQRRLMAALVAHGLMPKDEQERKALEAFDPYRLRAEALGEKALVPYHIGRALFHLNQRRGFRSNRKTDAASDEKGAIRTGSERLLEAMKARGAHTLGEYLWLRAQAWESDRSQIRPSLRARNVATGPKAEYDFYPTRAIVEDEFDQIWAAQAPHHASMTAAARESIRYIIFHQRPLEQPPIGKCSLDPATLPPAKDPDGYRAPWAHPLAQKFRIYQEVRNLAVGAAGDNKRPLTNEQGDLAAQALLAQKEVSFDKLRALLKLPADQIFNLESEKRDRLKGDATAAALSDKKRFGKAWRSIAAEKRTAIVERLLNEPDEEALTAWLAAECGLEAEAARRVADAPLPEGHCRLGLRAIRALLPHMEAGLNYPDACAAAGYDHSKPDTGELRDRLPYYGEWLQDEMVGSGDPKDDKEKRYGRFPNPTVHIGLGQVRRLVNMLIGEIGLPREIVVEMTRALKLSPKERAEIEREQRDNQRANERRAAKIRAFGVEPKPADLVKMRLWEELNLRDTAEPKCVFTGKQIDIRQLLSPEVEIEHLIPYAMSLDDSAANKTVCFIEANRAKRNMTPHQAFGSSPTIAGICFNWQEISDRAAGLPRNKRWRFEPDAHERYKEMGGFLGRQLNETGWLARAAKDYLKAVAQGGPYSVWVIPGRLTAMIRGKWGLNQLLPDHNYGGVKDRDETFRAAMDDMEFSGVKNRADHRHHAIDAFVAAMTDRSLLQRVSSAYDAARDKIKIPEPSWADWRDELEAGLRAMVVSHKPDHGVAGKLHEDTAYGDVAPPEPYGQGDKQQANLVYRKPVTSLNENEIERIRDRRLRDMLRDHVYESKRDGLDIAKALAGFGERHKDNPHIRHGLRRVRILKSEKPDYLVPIADGRTQKIYKFYSAGENFCVDIYETADGQWRGEPVRRFDVNQKGFRPTFSGQNPDARFIMRIAKGDLLRLDHEGREQIMVAHRLDVSANRLKLAAQNETGNLDRRHATSNEIDPFRWLMASYNTLRKAGAERVRVDEIGRVWRVRQEAPPGGD